MPYNLSLTVFTRVTAEALRVKIERKSTISFWSKISGTRGRPHQSFLHG